MTSSCRRSRPTTRPRPSRSSAAGTCSPPAAAWPATSTAARPKEAGQFDGKPVPPIDSDRTFGPELTRLAAKLGTKAGDPQSARAWLVRWLLNPSAHNPRTYMPARSTPTTRRPPCRRPTTSPPGCSASRSPPADRTFAPVEQPDMETLKILARVWLEKSLTRREIKSVLDEGKGFTKEAIENKPADADERFLEGEITPDKLMMYIGKKAINNLGCFGCHNIPGFESAKPIGTGLNDWGKKDPERIAFEDSEHFVEEHFNIVDVRRDLTAGREKDPAGQRAGSSRTANRRTRSSTPSSSNTGTRPASASCT